MQNNAIRDLLKANMTPEKIYHLALEELQKIQKEDEQQKKEEAARKKLIEAVTEYVSLFAKVSPEDIKEAEKMLYNVGETLKNKAKHDQTFKTILGKFGGM